jgi:hypothetical protein
MNPKNFVGITLTDAGACKLQKAILECGTDRNPGEYPTFKVVDGEA